MFLAARGTVAFPWSRDDLGCECVRECGFKEGAVSGLSPGLTGLPVARTVAHTLAQPCDAPSEGGLGTHAFSKLALLVVGPGGDGEVGRCQDNFIKWTCHPQSRRSPQPLLPPGLPTLACPAGAPHCALASFPLAACTSESSLSQTARSRSPEMSCGCTLLAASPSRSFPFCALLILVHLRPALNSSSYGL